MEMSLLAHMVRWAVAISYNKKQSRKKHLLETGGGEGGGKHYVTTDF